MAVKIENLREFVSKVELPEDFDLFKNTIVLDYGVKKKGSERTSQLKLTYEDGEDKLSTITASCGCTQPHIKEVDEKTQLLEIGYNTNILGAFSKNVVAFSKDKKRKQIIKITGKIVR